MSVGHSRASAGTPSLPAMVAAIGLLAAGGLVYRAMARYLDRPSDVTPLAKGTLAQLPLEIGDWRGHDIELREAIIKATATDDHINRGYRKIGHPGGVGLFVAYGVRARDLMPHRPEVCYPGAGWTLQHREDLSLAFDGGQTLPCRLLRFAGGGLGGSDVWVLNYYIVDGNYSPNESLLRARAVRGGGSIHYMVQVQLSATEALTDRPGQVAERLKELATQTAGPIRNLLPSDDDALSDGGPS